MSSSGYDKWMGWLVDGGEMPTLDLAEVPPPSTDDVVYLYVCFDCGKANNYWHSLCQECDDKLSTYEKG